MCTVIGWALIASTASRRIKFREYFCNASSTHSEVSLLIDAPRAATVTALEPTDVIQIERDSLLRLTEEAPELAAQMWPQLTISLSTRLRDTDTRYLSHVRETHDVADKMVGTGPLDEPEPESDS